MNRGKETLLIPKEIIRVEIYTKGSVKMTRYSVKVAKCTVKISKYTFKMVKSMLNVAKCVLKMAKYSVNVEKCIVAIIALTSFSA